MANNLLSGIPRLLQTLLRKVRNIGGSQHFSFAADPTPKVQGAVTSMQPDSPLPPEPTPPPTRYPDVPRDQGQLQQLIQSGLEGSDFSQAPVATLSGQLAQAGSQLPETVDPLLPIILSLMESGGGQNLSAENNLFNLGPGVSYPDVQTSILGGGPQDQLGLAGILREGGLYEPFRQSGDLADFFTQFTPESDPSNPSLEELLGRYQALRSIFVQ